MPVSATTTADATLPDAAISQLWTSLGGNASVLGAPSGGLGTCPDGVGHYQHYAGGSIYYTPATGAHEVHGAIHGLWSSLGWERSVLGYPLTNESGTPDKVGRYNHFQNGSIYWTPATGAHEVHGAIRGLWSSLGWERSFLGYPITNESGTPDTVGRYNHFQGGSIYWTPSTGAHEVHGAIRDLWSSIGWEKSFLGYPLSNETSSSDHGGTGRFNTFQGGTIIWTPVGGAHAINGAVPTVLEYDAGSITFPSGTAAGGGAHLTLAKDGTCHFTGHMHDSGAAAYNYSVAGVVKDVANQAYTFGHTGNIAGTFESGSRDDNWDQNAANPTVAQNWLVLAAAGQHSSWRSSVSIDLSGVINQIISAVGTVAGVVALFV
jgi:uncharacterized protein with LGFP repeats